MRQLLPILKRKLMLFLTKRLDNPVKFKTFGSLSFSSLLLIKKFFNFQVYYLFFFFLNRTHLSENLLHGKPGDIRNPSWLHAFTSRVSLSTATDHFADKGIHALSKHS